MCAQLVPYFVPNGWYCVMADQVHVAAMSDPSGVPVASAPVPADEAPSGGRSIWKIVLTLGALGAMSGLFLFFPIDWETVGAWGYVGIFFVTFVATASFILPIPYLLIVARAGMYLNPVTADAGGWPSGRARRVDWLRRRA